MTAKKADMCPIAYDLRYKTTIENRRKKIYCGFYSSCERYDKGDYPECKKVEKK